MGWSFKIKNPRSKRFLWQKKIINKLEVGLTVTTIEKSDYGMKNNPDASVVAEAENADVDLNCIRK